MTKNFNVQKASGEWEAFSETKLRNSLQRSGASGEMIDSIVWEMSRHLHDGIATKTIYKKAFQLLRRNVRSNAARYSLKNAIMELGPSGFPFEKFVGEILKSHGYSVETGKTVAGKCVNHEVDIVAFKDNETVMVECKYHNTQGKICGVQIPLYIRSRFNDIEYLLARQKGNLLKFHGWVVTNTRFSSDAVQYGECAGLRLIGWDYPHHGSLREMIENAGLFPVTVITGLNAKQKQKLIDSNIVLCSEVCSNPGLLDVLKLDHRNLKKVLGEFNDVCLSKKVF
jgi:Holliday junction resolvase